MTREASCLPRPVGETDCCQIESKVAEYSRKVYLQIALEVNA